MSQCHISAGFTIVHRAPLARGRGPSSFQICLKMDFCLCGAILNISTILKDCLCRPIGSTSFRAQVRGFITYLAQSLICPKSGTVSIQQYSFHFHQTSFPVGKHFLGHDFQNKFTSCRDLTQTELCKCIFSTRSPDINLYSLSTILSQKG